MQPMPRGNVQTKWPKRLEALLLLCLALHGVTLLIAGGRSGDWAAVALVFGLAGWAAFQPAPGSDTTAIRCAGALIAAWALSSTSGGPGSLFTLWYYPLAALYSLMLPLRFAAALPIVSALLYVSLGLLPGSPLPWGVTVAQGALIALVGGGALFVRLRRDESAAASEVDAADHNRQLRAGRLTALDRLARGLAHDFNNLFTVIAGQIALAQGKVDRQNPAHDHLQNAMASVEQAIALSRRLQVSSARATWEMGPVALNALIDSLAPEWQASLPATVVLHVEKSGELPPLCGDPDALSDLLREVIAHRAAAIGAGPGALTIRTSWRLLSDDDAGHGQYTGYSLGAGEYVVLTIEDSAETISNERLTTLFEPYQDNGSGAHGLALAVALGIVRSHQGGLAVTSAAKAGNALHFLFPTYRDDPVPLVASSPVVASDRRSSLRLILLVSTDISLRDSLERALGEPGLRVMIAVDGTRALALHTEFANSLELVIDYRGTTNELGPDLVSELLARDSRLPIVVIGRETPGSIPAAPQLTYLSPPVALPELATSVRERLSSPR